MGNIELITNPEEINELYTFIKQVPLDYPNYEEWLKKCKRELELGYKKAFVYKKNNQIIGNLIFQPHKQDPLLLELKNSRVIEEYKRKRVFSRLIKEAIIYAKKNNFKGIIADTHSDNEGILKSLQKLGFSVYSYENLYEPKLETVLFLDFSIKGASLDSILRNIQIKLEILERAILKLFKVLFN